MTNIDKLAEIFPQCITEAEDEDGNLIRAIDFELLSDKVVDGYDVLNYGGKILACFDKKFARKFLFRDA